MNAAVSQANLADGIDQAATLALMDAYARDPMGDARPLSEYARGRLIEGLARFPTAQVFLARHNGRPVGIATCFRGFSTFAARPVVNIHDLFVEPEFRGLGIGRLLLEAVEREARAAGCCKLTLEVQQCNPRARAVYGAFGFAPAVYAADADADGGSLYLAKPLA